MITLSELTEVLGWTVLINFTFITVAALAMRLFKNLILPIQSRVFGISEKELKKIYFQYLANYKLLILVIFASPYLALKIMGY